MSLANILWAVVVILVVVWLIGLITPFGASLGALLHVLLVIAVIIVIYNLLVGRSAV